MPVPQPGGVINFLLIFLFGGGGWFLAAYLKTAPARHSGESGPVSSGAPGNLPGIFAADALSLRSATKAGAHDFETLLSRYGSGSRDLGLLIVPLVEKWVAADPAGALADALPRCREHAPDALPRVMALLAARPEINPAALLAALPSGPLRGACLSSLGGAWGRAGKEEPLATGGTENRAGRTLFLQEWHRGRATVDAAAAVKSAAALKDADDREAALRGCLLARAVTEPLSVLHEAARRDDFLEIAEETFRTWLPRDSAAAWNFAASLKNDPRLPALAVVLLRAETTRRRVSESLPELTTLLGRLFPAGSPPEVEEILIPALAAEDAAGPRHLIDARPGTVDMFHLPAGVIVFDTLCVSDPAGAWRFAEAWIQAAGGKDGRATNPWKSAARREHATPAERLESGFPDYTDMAALARHWLKADPSAALTAFCGENIPSGLQTLALQTALSPSGANLPPEELKEWAKHQSLRLQQLIAAETDKPGGK